MAIKGGAENREIKEIKEFKEFREFRENGKLFQQQPLTNDLRRFEQTERGCCNRRLLGLADDDRKFIFKVAYLTKTIICDSKQQPKKDKSATPPQVERSFRRGNRQKIGGNLSIAAYLRRVAPPKTTNPNLNK